MLLSNFTDVKGYRRNYKGKSILVNPFKRKDKKTSKKLKDIAIGTGIVGTALLLKNRKNIGKLISNRNNIIKGFRRGVNVSKRNEGNIIDQLVTGVKGARRGNNITKGKFSNIKSKPKVTSKVESPVRKEYEMIEDPWNQDIRLKPASNTNSINRQQKALPPASPKKPYNSPTLTNKGNVEIIDEWAVPQSAKPKTNNTPVRLKYKFERDPSLPNRGSTPKPRKSLEVREDGLEVTLDYGTLNSQQAGRLRGMRKRAFFARNSQKKNLKELIEQRSIEDTEKVKNFFRNIRGDK